MTQKKNKFPIVSLKQICTKPQYGYTTSGVDFGEIKLLRTTDITPGFIDWKRVPFCKYSPENIEKFLLQENDIVVSRAGSIGVSMLIKNPDKSVFASYLIRFKPIETIVFPEYMAYFLQSPLYWKSVNEKSSGITLQNINASKLESIEIPLPDLTTQHLIVSEIEKQFSRLNEGLSSLIRIKEDLRSYRASLLKSAVVGRLTAEWRSEHPDIESADILLDRIHTARRKKWISENPGKKYKEIENVREMNNSIPENWLYTNVGSTLEFLTDYHANGSYEKLKEFVVLLDDKDHAIMIRSTNFEKHDFDVNLKYISEFAYNNLKKTKLFGGEILMSKIGNAGKVYYMPNLGVPCSLAMNLFMIRFDEELLNTKYMYYHLVSIQSKIEINGHIKGVGNPTIDKDAVRSIHINLPPLLEQQRIVEILEEKFSVIDSLESLVNANIRRAENLKQSILKKAFSEELISE